MVRRGLRGAGKAYAIALMGMACDIFSALSFRGNRIAPLYPVVDFYAERTLGGGHEGLRAKEASEIVDMVFGGFTNALRRGGRVI